MRKYIDAASNLLNESRAQQVSVFMNQPEITVLINPDAVQIDNYLRKLQYKVLRGHLGQRLIVWDGEWATHDHIDDTGEMGRLDGIRFTFSAWGAGPTVRLASYGRGSKFPVNPETLDDFETAAEILEFAKNSPLMKRAFGNATFQI